MTADRQQAGLLIFPCNGNGIEALDCIGSDYRLVGFISDAPVRDAYVALAGEILARDALARYPDARVLAVPGSAVTYLQRRQVIESLGVEPDRWARVIHPRATVSASARIGRNVLIMAGAVITSNAVIGDHVCILPNTVIHHDSRIGDWTLIGSNVTVAGGTSIGENCYVGSGSSIMNGLRIGDRTLVGLGSCVIRDTPPDSVVAGSPARPLRKPA